MGDLEERDRQLTTAIKDTADHAEQRGSPTSEEQLVQLLAREDQRIEGLPINRLDVKQMLNNIRADREAFEKSLQKYHNENTSLLSSNARLDQENDALQISLTQEKNRSLLGRLWGWLWGFGMTGVIVAVILVVVFPTLGVPLMSYVVNLIVTTVPQLIALFGVVGKKVFDGVIIGVQQISDEISHHPDDKTFTKKEVQEILKKNLRDATDSAAKAVISHRKHALKIKN